MSDIPIIVCTEGSLKGQIYEVPSTGLEIGRADTTAITINDDGVSRFHASISYDNGQLWLRDSGSRNGVFVNEQRLTDYRGLKVNDTIVIAKHVFVVKWKSEVQPSAPEDTAPDETKSSWWWPFSS